MLPLTSVQRLLFVSLCLIAVSCRWTPAAAATASNSESGSAAAPFPACLAGDASCGEARGSHCCPRGTSFLPLSSVSSSSAADDVPQCLSDSTSSSETGAISWCSGTATATATINTGTTERSPDSAAPIRPRARATTMAHESIPVSRGSRRFQYSVVMDHWGREASKWSRSRKAAANLTVDGSIPFTRNASHIRMHANKLVQEGHTVLHYDVTHSAALRILDQDENVLQIFCSNQQTSVPDGSASARASASTSPSSEFQPSEQSLLGLDLTVSNVSAALATYAVGSIVHGSDMWGCSGNQTTILMEVTNVRNSFEHESIVTLFGRQSTYQSAFEEAQITFQQPTPSQKAQFAGVDSSTTSPTSESDPQPKNGSARRLLRHLNIASHSDKFSLTNTEFELPVTDPNAGTHQPPAPMPPLSSIHHKAKPLSSGLTITMDKSVYLPSDQAKVTISTSTPLTRATMTATIYAKYPIASDSALSMSVTMTASSSGLMAGVTQQFTFPSFSYLQATSSECYYYLSISYCITTSVLGACKWSDDGPSYSYLFQVWSPYSMSGSWPSSGVATTQAYQVGCSDNPCTKSDTVSNLLCAVCSPTRQLAIKASCTNCGVSYSAQITNFVLDDSIVSTAPYLKSSIIVDATVTTQLKLTAQADLAISDSSTLHLVAPQTISIPGLSIGIAGLTIGATVAFGLDLGTTFNLQSSVNVGASAAVVTTVQATASFDSTTSSKVSFSRIGPNINFQSTPTVTVSASGVLEFEVDLIPTLVVGVSHIASVTLSATAFAKLNARMQYPPFPALSASSLPYSIASLASTSVVANGPCTTPHMIEYVITGGAKSMSLAAAIKVDISSSIGLPSSFDYNYAFTPLTFPDIIYQLLTGCLVSIDSSVTAPSLDLTIQSSRGTGLTSNAIAALQLSFVMDIAKSLAVDANRIRVVLKTIQTSAVARPMHLSSHNEALNQVNWKVHPMSTSVPSAQVSILTAMDGSTVSSASLMTQLQTQISTASSAFMSTTSGASIVIYSWKTGSFGACSVTCGSGTQTRSVSCIGSDSSVGTSSQCTTAMPASQQTCSGASACSSASAGSSQQSGSTGTSQQQPSSSTPNANPAGDGSSGSSSATTDAPTSPQGIGGLNATASSDSSTSTGPFGLTAVQALIAGSVGGAIAMLLIVCIARLIYRSCASTAPVMSTPLTDVRIGPQDKSDKMLKNLEAEPGSPVDLSPQPVKVHLQENVSTVAVIPPMTSSRAFTPVSPSAGVPLRQSSQIASVAPTSVATRANSNARVTPAALRSMLTSPSTPAAGSAGSTRSPSATASPSKTLRNPLTN